MAYDKIVDSGVLDGKLTAIADAIRTKGGTTGELEFPDGFVSAVEGIQAGGGGDFLESWLAKTLEAVDSDVECAIDESQFAFQANLKTVNLPNAVSYFGRDSAKAFSGCSALERVNLGKITKLNGRVFYGCTNLIEVIAPMVTESHDYVFGNCTAIEKLDFPSLTWLRYGNTFNGATKLHALILRANQVVTLQNVNTFANTPFESGGTGGTVYVPSALIESYQTATNWSTLYAAGTCNFVAIEGSEYE